MRAYRVELTKNAKRYIRFEPSQATARLASKDLMHTYDAKRSDVDVTEVEIPYGKEYLLQWLNELMEEILNG